MSKTEQLDILQLLGKDKITKAEFESLVKDLLYSLKGRLDDRDKISEANSKKLQQEYKQEIANLISRFKGLELSLSKFTTNDDLKIATKALERQLEGVKQEPVELDIPSIDEIEDRIEQNLPKYGEKFRDGLELLKGDERLDVSAIKGLKEMFKDNKPTITNHSIVGRDIITDIDISDQLDGVTKTFNIQAIYNIISVSLNSYPYGSLRKGIDYTFTPTTITFTDEIAVATQLSTGQKCIITAVLG